MEISKTFDFEASHILPRHPGKCSRLHGHSWKLTVYIIGPINIETGFVMDYADLKARVQPLIDRLDHRHLGAWPVGAGEIRCRDWEVPGLPKNIYPSSEMLLWWIAEQLNPVLDESNIINTIRRTWSKLELNETCTSKCILTREEYETIRNVEGRDSSS